MKQFPNLDKPPLTVLIVGNGLAIDLCCNHAPDKLGSWNTSRPLEWQVMTPGEPGVPFRDRLPAFNAAVREFQRTPARLSDFDVIDHIRRRYFADPQDFDAMRAFVEMRHYVALAYSTFQVAVDQVDLTGWRWVEYVASLGHDLIGAFSFNYDLVLERAMETALIPYFRRGLPEEEGHGGRIIVKPHGSVDFDTQHLVIGEPPGGWYPLRNWIDQANTAIQRVPGDDLLRRRANPELVAPMQPTTLRHFQWVAPGFDGFATHGAPLVGTCVIAGISYWDVDRPEIDEALDMLLPSTEVVVANPYPPPELLSALDRRGLTHIERDGPPF